MDDEAGPSTVNFEGLEAESSTEQVNENQSVLKLIEASGKIMQRHFTDIAKASHHKRVLSTMKDANITPVGLKPKVQVTAFKQTESLSKSIADILDQAAVARMDQLKEHYTQCISKSKGEANDVLSSVITKIEEEPDNIASLKAKWTETWQNKDFYNYL